MHEKLNPKLINISSDGCSSLVYYNMLIVVVVDEIGTVIVLKSIGGVDSYVYSLIVSFPCIRVTLLLKSEYFQYHLVS